jgi:ubiquinone/menaquinone biosynthesis C-methylase UbiE
VSDVKQVIQERFGQAAANYAQAAIHAQGPDLAWMVQALSLRGDERVLDIGTGTGHTAFAFALHVRQVEGLDLTPAMLLQAELGAQERGLTNVSFSRGDVEHLPREDASYDVVTCRWCAHHFLHLRRALAEIARVLKPNGFFLLVDSYSPPSVRADTFLNTLETLRDSSHVRNYTLQEWLEALETVGLHGEILHEWPLHLDGEDWVARMQTPPVYVAAIRALLEGAEAELRHNLHITEGANWGFNLPAVLLRAQKPPAFVDEED